MLTHISAQPHDFFPGSLSNEQRRAESGPSRGPGHLHHAAVDHRTSIIYTIIPVDAFRFPTFSPDHGNIRPTLQLRTGNDKAPKMVRIAKALGLVILSVVVLILSLISYVSLRKDSLFSSNKYYPGGPRIMFHAGFRSQFAMNFLDPSFIPLTNALNEELQGKPYKWKFNRTAFHQQRKEIFSYINIPNNFSLIKNSVRVGQLMHFDYSSHKYVFSISNNFKSLLPDTSPILNKHYSTCAVVGNSGILTGSHCGPEIDHADFVFRCNFAPTEVYSKDVGKKTNLTTFNPSILERYYNNLLTIQDRNNFFLNLKKLEGAILWIPAFFLHTSATVTRTLVDFFVEHKGQLKVELAWPGNIMHDVNKYWKTKNLSPKRLSTGILMYTLASAMCDEIHLYGFWPFGWDPNTGKELPYHYYDKKGTKFTTKWQETHQLPSEFKLLYKLHREGVTKLSLTHCT
ncbi:Sia-alpha-2,3-Gal-beta-1,4-GlcNAc-R:alpha 2,8-sialyltransferase [Ataeniobius toweri]|uniref:Sia-alpha-2,3-Gal-beta-1,4-GlcNAc-R:alpha 2,8-sialyltransferase n=1 Tax=Ataeniobius toweri TaxID=208326 RepID=A0ABU7A221_9TELE|nr:Sia-alpha-2,3-Gal-beta-1,4-GlcNAc-R:alpha 2,8-sialyltransferase [Ataeniobius toweri]